MTLWASLRPCTGVFDSDECIKRTQTFLVLTYLSSYHHHRDNPFHNFHHAAHVTMSVSKLLSRIVAPDVMSQEGELESKLHDHTYGT